MKNKETILCAAIWYKEFKKPIHSPVNIDNGVVLCGHRHGHIIGQMMSMTGKRTVKYGKDAVGDNVQGFLTSSNRFITREEAYELFKENGGMPEFDNLLYSEDLY